MISVALQFSHPNNMQLLSERSWFSEEVMNRVSLSLYSYPTEYIH